MKGVQISARDDEPLVRDVEPGGEARDAAGRVEARAG